MLNLLPTELHNYSMADMIRGLIAAKKSALYKNGIELPMLGNGIPIRSARAAITISIKALGIEPGSRIGVPLYCCPVVFKAVNAANCSLRFLDIDPTTFCISSEDLFAKRSDIDAVVAVHMFGNICDILSLQDAIGDKPIIEDCAQALGSKLNGRSAGAIGKIGVFSFRSGKYLSVGEGAAIITSQPDLRQKIIQLVAELVRPAAVDEFIHPISIFLRSKLRRKPFWGLVGSYLWQLYSEKTDFMDKSPIVMSQIFKSDLEIARRRIAHLDYMIKIQRDNAQFYIRNLRLDPSMLCLEKPGTFYNRLAFPVVFSSTEHRDLMRAYLRSRGVSAAAPYEEVIGGVVKNYNYSGDCPVAEQLLRMTLIIPCHHKLTKLETRRIIQSLNKGWEYLSRRASCKPL